MKVKQLLDYGIKQLKDSKVQTPVLDAQILLADILNIPTWKLITIKDESLNQSIVDEFIRRIDKRIKGYPVAYIIGKKEFFGLKFIVNEGVLIPRPETEVLVEKVLERLDKKTPYLGLDIGVGSGAIAISILKNRPYIKMVGVDISPIALELTKKNAKIHKVSDRLHLKKSDLFKELSGYKFDFIVSNPPYIPLEEYEKLQKEVKKEPKEALIASKGGLEFYERIVNQIEKYLKPSGFVAFEVGYNQGEKVKNILKEHGFEAKSYKDLQGIDRVIIGEKNGNK